MKTTSQTGPRSSVSVLQKASQLALATVNASQNIRRNKAAFKRLAKDASELVDDMIHFHRSMEDHLPQVLPEDLAVVFQGTVDSLNSIQSFTLTVASRNFFMALLCSRSDVKGIKTHVQTLARNKGSFKVISNIYLQGVVTKLSAEAGR